MKYFYHMFIRSLCLILQLCQDFRWSPYYKL